jgi:hypothetical protein
MNGLHSTRSESKSASYACSLTQIPVALAGAVGSRRHFCPSPQPSSSRHPRIPTVSPARMPSSQNVAPSSTIRVSPDSIERHVPPANTSPSSSTPPWLSHWTMPVWPPLEI